MKFTFRGGSHVREHKETAGIRTVRLPEPPQVSLPLSQHIGAPAKPLVKEGDAVKKGDVIAKAGEGLSVNIHASIDAIVKEVTNKYIRCER